MAFYYSSTSRRGHPALFLFGVRGWDIFPNGLACRNQAWVMEKRRKMSWDSKGKENYLGTRSFNWLKTQYF